MTRKAVANKTHENANRPIGKTDAGSATLRRTNPAASSADAAIKPLDRSEEIALPNCDLAPRLQSIILLCAIVGFALTLASNLFAPIDPSGPRSVLTIHHYIGRAAAIFTYFFVALACLKHAPRPIVLFAAAFACKTLFATGSTIAAMQDLSMIEPYFSEACAMLGDIGDALIGLLFLNLLACFRPHISTAAIALSIMGSHALFLLAQDLSNDALSCIKAAFLFIGIALAAFAYSKTGLFSSDSEDGPQKPTFFAKTTEDLLLVLLCVAVFPFLFVLVAQMSDSAGVNLGIFNAPVETAGIATLLIFAIASFLKKGQTSMESIFAVATPFFATAIALIPVFWGNESFVFAAVIKCGFLLYNTLLWSFLARKAQGETRVSLLYFSVATGLMELFALLGRATGSLLFASGFVNADSIANVSLAAIWVLSMGLLVFFLLFRKREKSRPRNTTSQGDNRAPSASVEPDQDLYLKKCHTFADAFGLSERELEVLAEFSRGRSADYIAKEFFISRETVKTHLKRIYAKAGIHNRQELINAIEQGCAQSEQGPRK